MNTGYVDTGNSKRSRRREEVYLSREVPWAVRDAKPAFRRAVDQVRGSAEISSKVDVVFQKLHNFRRRAISKLPRERGDWKTAVANEFSIHAAAYLANQQINPVVLTKAANTGR